MGEVNRHERIAVVEEGGEGSGEAEREKLQIPGEAAQRKKHYLDENKRKEFVFEKGRQYLVDFGNPYLGFNGMSIC